MEVLTPIFVAVIAALLFIIFHYVIWRLDCSRNWSVVLITGLSIVTVHVWDDALSTILYGDRSFRID